MNNKIAIVGAGKVGTEAANSIMRMQIGDCALIDADGPMAQGKSLDLLHSTPLHMSSVAIEGGGDYKLLRGADIVVISAGLARTPGMSRDDLLEANFRVMKEIIPQIVTNAPQNAIFIVVTNPLDAMTYAAWKLSGKVSTQVIGMAGALDAARFEAFIAQKLKLSTEDVHGMVLGSHGDLMVPLARYATVAGIRVGELMDETEMNAIVERTKNAGTELVGLLKTGSAFYAAGTAVAIMADAIIHDKRKVVCSAVLSNGTYGFTDLVIGLPVVLCRSGVDRIIELKLNEFEMAQLKKAAFHLKQLQDKVDCLIDSM
jgi:malate dehydrogenase